MLWSHGPNFFLFGIEIAIFHTNHVLANLRISKIYLTEPRNNVSFSWRNVNLHERDSVQDRSEIFLHLKNCPLSADRLRTRVKTLFFITK